MHNSQHKGAILIVVLWFIVIVTIMVATLSSETRLSTKVVLYNKMGLQTWNDTLAALRAAEMELLINKMPDPPGAEDEVELELRRDKKYRFNGEVLELAYPIPETVKVRIYNNSGKINIQQLSRDKLKVRQLLEMFVGTEDLERLTTLENAWLDWVDKDDLSRLDGAERDYYETLTPPYEPRNAPIETVAEILLIKGFDEVFKDIDIENIFTVYGGTAGVNPNFATREALMLLPGMDASIIDRILTIRRVKEITSISDFSFLVEPEQLTLFKQWINFSTTDYYTIAIQTKSPAEIAAINAKKDEEQEDIFFKREEEEEEQEITEFDESVDPFNLPTPSEKQFAYMVTVQPKGNKQFPIIYKVNPYGALPDTRHEQIPIERLQQMLLDGMLEFEGEGFSGGGSMPF